MHRASLVGVLRCSSTAGTETPFAIPGLPRLDDTCETTFAGLPRFTVPLEITFAGLPSFAGAFATAFAGLPLFSGSFFDTLSAVVTLFRVLGIVTSSYYYFGPSGVSQPVIVSRIHHTLFWSGVIRPHGESALYLLFFFQFTFFLWS